MEEHCADHNQGIRLPLYSYANIESYIVQFTRNIFSTCILISKVHTISITRLRSMHKYMIILSTRMNCGILENARWWNKTTHTIKLKWQFQRNTWFIIIVAVCAELTITSYLCISLAQPLLFSFCASLWRKMLFYFCPPLGAKKRFILSLISHAHFTNPLNVDVYQIERKIKFCSWNCGHINKLSDCVCVNASIISHDLPFSQFHNIWNISLALSRCKKNTKEKIVPIIVNVPVVPIYTFN